MQHQQTTASDRSLTIDRRRIADDTPAYLIAEIGHNHGGSLERAMAMVDTAQAAGADAVKFQTRAPREVYAPGDRPGAYDYRSDNPQWMDPVYGRHRELLEFDAEAWRALFAHCRARGITAFSTPFDHASLERLAELGVPAVKIASGDATNLPLIDHAATLGVPLIVSTGGCEQEEVDRVVELLEGRGAAFALLQCACIYPAPDDVLNLRVIETYRARYPGVVTGLSTHSPDWAATLAAFTLGGRIFEHHYTNDRGWKGTDNPFSLIPADLARLRQACDAVLPALGRPEKSRDPREESYTVERRKSLHWRRDLAGGAVVSAADLIALSPGGGIGPDRLADLVGRRTARPVGALAPARPDDLG